MQGRINNFKKKEPNYINYNSSVAKSVLMKIKLDNVIKKGRWVCC